MFYNQIFENKEERFHENLERRWNEFESGRSNAGIGGEKLKMVKD